MHTLLDEFDYSIIFSGCMHGSLSLALESFSFMQFLSMAIS